MRLTNKDSLYYKCGYDKKLTKLCDLEDLEEENGCELLDLFKALKNGAYIKKEKVFIEGKDLRLGFDEEGKCILICDKMFGIYLPGEWSLKC